MLTKLIDGIILYFSEAKIILEQRAEERLNAHFHMQDRPSRASGLRNHLSVFNKHALCYTGVHFAQLNPCNLE